MDDLQTLARIVNDALAVNPVKRVRDTIQAAHDGRLRDFVTDENLHLFRRFRNNVSGDANVLIDFAQGWED